MQFTPNIKERYAAALRILITHRIIKGEVTPKNKKLLKIITVFSHLVRKETNQNVNLFKNAEKLLQYALQKLKEKGVLLKYKINREQNYKVDYNLLKLLILELVTNPTQSIVYLQIKFLNDRMIFVVKNANLSKISKCLAKKLKANLIKIRGESNFAVMLSAPCVLNENLIEDYEDYKNPFSTVNIMLFE